MDGWIDGYRYEYGYIDTDTDIDIDIDIGRLIEIKNFFSVDSARLILMEHYRKTRVQTNRFKSAKVYE